MSAATFLEASVLKVHAQSSKAAKALLVEAGAELMKVEFWKSRMLAYVRDLPCHVECWDAVEQSFADVASIEGLTDENMGKIVDLLQKCPRWSEQLRRASLQSLETELVAKLQKLFQQVMEPSGLHAAANMQAILAEAIIAFPLSKQIDTLKQQMGETLASLEADASATMLKALLVKIASVTKPVDLLPLVEEFNGHTGKACSLSPADLEPAFVTALQMLSVVMNGEEDMKGKPICVITWLETLCTLQDDKADSGKLLLLASDCAGHALEIHFHDGMSPADGEHSSLSSLQALRHEYLKLMKSMEAVKLALPKIPKADIHAGWIEGFSKKTSAAAEFLKSQLAWHEAKEKEKMESHISSSKQTLEKCKKWLDKCKTAKTLKDAIALAKESVLQMAPGAIDKDAKALNEVGGFNNLDIIGLQFPVC
eukprot:6492578-Amphidinium_carterae.2